MALALWGAAILWLAYAVAAALYAAPLPFHVGWWEFTFPPGMLALTTIVLGDELSAEFFTVLGTVRFPPLPVLRRSTSPILQVRRR